MISFLNSDEKECSQSILTHTDSLNAKHLLLDHFKHSIDINQSTPDPAEQEHVSLRLRLPDSKCPIFNLSTFSTSTHFDDFTQLRGPTEFQVPLHKMSACSILSCIHSNVFNFFVYFQDITLAEMVASLLPIALDSSDAEYMRLFVEILPILLAPSNQEVNPSKTLPNLASIQVFYFVP